MADTNGTAPANDTEAMLKRVPDDITIPPVVSPSSSDPRMRERDHD